MSNIKLTLPPHYSCFFQNTVHTMAGPRDPAFAAAVTAMGITRAPALPNLTVCYVPGPGDAAHPVFSQTEAGAVLDTFTGEAGATPDHPAYRVSRLHLHMRAEDGRMASRVMDPRPGDCLSYAAKWGSVRYVSRNQSAPLI